MSDVLRIFKSRLPRITYVFRDGSLCVFVPRTNQREGNFLTKDPVRIKELEEVARGHQHIFIDSEESEVEEHLADPAVAYRDQIAQAEKQKIIDLLGDQNQMRAAGISPDAMSKLIAQISGRDMGTSEADFSASISGSSNTVGQAESNGAGVTASPSAKK